MNSVERFRRVLSFQQVDRLPVIEWAPWWDKTIERWRGEGLPAALKGDGEIRDYLGQDRFRHFWIGPRASGCPQPASHGAPLIQSLEDYERLKSFLYPSPPFDPDWVRPWAEPHESGRTAVWITLEGFFWFPRGLFGIQPHFYAFYDQPDLMNRINEDLLAFNLRALEQFCAILRPEFMTFAEDMSYNRGPMLSKAMFDEFLAPFYRRIVPRIRELGIVPMIDSDGDVTAMIPWLEEIGIEGILPLERQAGVDVAKIRARHPRFRMIGGFDKMVMKLGPQAMRREFERLLPVMRTLGFIPGVDHQTPPDVSLDAYRQYVSLLREYCERAGERA